MRPYITPRFANDPRCLRCGRFLVGTVGLALVATLLAGCGSSLATVHGKVTLPDGQPAQQVTVTFEERDLHLGATGTTDASGIYHLSSQSPGDGAPPGKYVISVHQPGPADSNDPEPARIFPKRYESSATSELSFEVKPGDNTFNIELRAK